jgi:hypothetical protein
LSAGAQRAKAEATKQSRNRRTRTVDCFAGAHSRDPLARDDGLLASFILNPPDACYIRSSGIIERLNWPRQNEY